MSLKRAIRRCVALMAVILLVAVVASAMPCSVESYVEQSREVAARTTDTHEPRFELSEGVALLAPTTTMAHATPPSVRTLPRQHRTSAGASSLQCALKSIDATTTASRYGMYNHKILFVSHARLHYLNRLVRLRI